MYVCIYLVIYLKKTIKKGYNIYIIYINIMYVYI